MRIVMMGYLRDDRALDTIATAEDKIAYLKLGQCQILRAQSFGIGK